MWGSRGVGQLRCGAVAVQGCCSVGQLICGAIAVWGSCGVGQSRCGGFYCEGEMHCVGVQVVTKPEFIAFLAFLSFSANSVKN